MRQDKRWVAFMREQYPPGTRIRLTQMDDPYSPVPDGTLGTVAFVDDACQIHMNWDNGRTLALIPDKDRFSVIVPETKQAAAKQKIDSNRLAEGLPELCFSVLSSTGDLICIKRGEDGYYPSDWNTGDKAHNQELANYNNERLGVTAAQRLAMECGSMHGWSIPGADPKAYEQETSQTMTMGGM